jgi:predicted oxidoreductase
MAATETAVPLVQAALVPHLEMRGQTPRRSVEQSLRALRRDRLDVLLSHERLAEHVADQFDDAIAALKQDGLIVRAGCSGQINNLLSVLRSARSAEVAQTSILDAKALPPIAEKRFYNAGALARRLVSVDRSSIEAIEALKDVTEPRFNGNLAGAATAGAIAWIQRRHPASILIVNASSAERLWPLVEVGTSKPLQAWAESFSPCLQRLTESSAILA